MSIYSLPGANFGFRTHLYTSHLCLIFMHFQTTSDIYIETSSEKMKNWREKKVPPSPIPQC